MLQAEGAISHNHFLWEGLSRGLLVGFFGEHMQVKSYITQKTTFWEYDQAIEIKVKYLVIDALSSYNMIIGQPTFNKLDTTLSTLYLCMKYLLSNGRIGVTQGDQEISRKCYVESLGPLGANANKVVQE